MSAHSGKFGIVNGHNTVRNWSISEVQEAKEYFASNTDGGAGRKPGVYDWTGSFGAYGGQPSLFPGDTFEFGGYTAPDDDVEGSIGQRYVGSAIVDSLAITWNWNAAELIAYVISFSGNGALVKDTGIYTDVASIDAPPIQLAKIEFDLALPLTFVEWTDIDNATLTISADNQAYVDSSSIVAGKLWRKRLKGNIDFTASLVENKTLRATPNPQVGDNFELKMFVNATEFWALKWVHVLDASGITVDREAGTVIQKTNNFAMNGWNPTVGYIKHPDLSSKWPT